jgi:cytochrome c biogenesis protein CcdA/thiol-disulfide isomerase/thioredoxin
MFLFIGAFIAGALTVLAPCVLPLLPVIIGGSISGDTRDKRRPFLIALSLAVSLIVFTVLLKATTVLINVPPQAFTYLSGGIIVALGLATLFPFVYTRLIVALGIEHRTQTLLGKGTSSRRQWLGPIITGAALGPVFSSCSPVYAYILATILPAHFATAMSYIVSYVVGLSLVLLAVSYYGQRLTTRLRFASDPRGVFQRGLGVLFILVGVLIITGSGTKLQVWTANHTPFDFDNLSSKLIPKQKNAKVPTVSSSSSLYNVQPGVAAPNFVGIQDWINSDPLTLAQLKGKVVLVDFWTYTCINCIRSIPYVEGWYQAYQKDGLVVVGVEAPEFSYEKTPGNVEAAVKQDKITYPVAIDGNLETWNAYQNEYWPAEYLIDQSGNIRRVDYGEGEYNQMEQAIRGLLAENSAVKLPSKLVVPGNTPPPVNTSQTPETYLGTNRADAYVGSPSLGSGSTYTFARQLGTSEWSLSGGWSVSGTSITAGKNAKLEINIASKNVYMVGGAPSSSPVTVSFNGQSISQLGYAGAGVTNSQVAIHMSNLYRIASFPRFMSGVITLNVPPGVSINTFTFGN